MNKTLALIATTMLLSSTAMAEMPSKGNGTDAATPDASKQNNEMHRGPDGHDGPPRGGRMFKEMDTNDDGVVTKAESVAFNDKKFNERDTNKDGKITQDEAKAHYKERREEGRERREERREKRNGGGDQAPTQGQ